MQKTISFMMLGIFLLSLNACSESPTNTASSAPANSTDSASMETDTASMETDSASMATDSKEPESSAEGAAGAAVAVGAETPEEALRSFFAAMLNADFDALKIYAVEHPDLEILLQDEDLTEEQLQTMQEVFANAPITSQSVGDTFSIAGGPKAEVTESMVDENHKLLTMIGNPAPFPVHKLEGYWKVDPGTIIAVRKAAAKLSQDR